MARTGFRRDDGLSSTARGYGADWRRARKVKLDQQPLCEPCQAAGRVTAATQVHHKRRFSGIADPLRLDPANHESICDRCHLGESARQASGTALVAIGADGWPVGASN